MPTIIISLCRWGLEEGPAVPVLNSVQKWVENFAPFDAHRVAVVYTPPLKKETTAPGEQLGMVDLQVGYKTDFYFHNSFTAVRLNEGEVLVGADAVFRGFLHVGCEANLVCISPGFPMVLMCKAGFLMIHFR